MDAATKTLAEACRILMNPPLPDTEVRAAIFSKFPSEKLAHTIESAYALIKPPDDIFSSELFMSNENALEEIKQVTLGDFRDTPIPKLIREAIEPHSAVIFYASNDPTGSGGSGTLVNYKGIKGILTASHVVAPLRHKRTVFLPCSPRRGTNDIWDVVKVPFCRILTIDDLNMYDTPEWKKNWSENGLDISLLQFDDSVFDEIVRCWRKQPLDLAKMRARYHSENDKYWSPGKKYDWTWTISGVPREGCGIIEAGVSYFPKAGVYIGGGTTRLCVNTMQNVNAPFTGMDVDIIETQIRPTQDLLPEDFSGVSGGGIYQTRERQIGNQYIIEEVLLAGVFVAGDEANGGLVSRGHISLYDVFCTYLDQ